MPSAPPGSRPGPSDHIRYLREFREIDPVQVLSGPVEVGERHLLAYHEIRNPSDGNVAATMRRRIVCDNHGPTPSARAPKQPWWHYPTRQAT